LNHFPLRLASSKDRLEGEGHAGIGFAFIAYGIGLNLAPVWLLHAVLLPVNCWRLWQGGKACGTRIR
jgi:hypothetical protein